MPAARRKEPAEAHDPEARYRQGLGESHRGELTSLQMLNTALEGFLARGDAKGAALCSAALKISGQVMGNYRRFPEHVARLAVAREPEFPWSDFDDELVALAGLLAGLIFFGPDDPLLEACVERIMTLLELELDVNVKFADGDPARVARRQSRRRGTNRPPLARARRTSPHFARLDVIV